MWRGARDPDKSIQHVDTCRTGVESCSRAARSYCSGVERPERAPSNSVLLLGKPICTQEVKVQFSGAELLLFSQLNPLFFEVFVKKHKTQNPTEMLSLNQDSRKQAHPGTCVRRANQKASQQGSCLCMFRGFCVFGSLEEHTSKNRLSKCIISNFQKFRAETFRPSPGHWS